MAVTEAPPRELAPEPERGRLLDWLKTTDHKKIGILYLINSFAFFVVGGVFALLMRTELARPGTQIFQPHAYNQLFTLHGTLMIFLVIFPLLAGLRELLRSAADRRARHGVPADQRAVVLAPAGRRAHDPVRVPRRRAARPRPVGRTTRRCPSSSARARTSGSPG